MTIKEAIASVVATGLLLAVLAFGYGMIRGGIEKAFQLPSRNLVVCEKAWVERDEAALLYLDCTLAKR